MVPMPTTQDIETARQLFEANEPRGLFYRAATELVALALDGKISLSVAEAVAVLLQSWNRMFYRYRKFDSQHFADIEQLIETHRPELMALRQQTIESFNQEEKNKVLCIFKAFETVLGPVGAAKALHLLAPLFFPLWDRAIARAYVLSLGKWGTNGDRYCRFMEIVKEQVQNLGGNQPNGRNLLKAIDEYNYCKYSRGWM